VAHHASVSLTVSANGRNASPLAIRFAVLDRGVTDVVSFEHDEGHRLWNLMRLEELVVIDPHQS
jgi:hypothetical protein